VVDSQTYYMFFFLNAVCAGSPSIIMQTSKIRNSRKAVKQKCEVSYILVGSLILNSVTGIQPKLEIKYLAGSSLF